MDSETGRRVVHQAAAARELINVGGNGDLIRRRVESGTMLDVSSVSLIQSVSQSQSRGMWSRSSWLLFPSS